MMGRDEKMAPRSNAPLPLVTALLLIAAISRGQAENVYRLSGSDVTLSPDFHGDFKEITWLLNDSSLVELDDKQQVHWYNLEFRKLKGGAFINKNTGQLTIPQLTFSDSGNYKAEVKLQDRTLRYTSITLTVLDPVVPIITKQTTEGWIRLSCESAIPGVSYEWQNDKGNIVSNDKTCTIPTSTEAVTLTCIASNQVSNGSASVTIEPPGRRLSVWDIAEIIGWIFVIILILVIIIEKIRGRCRDGRRLFCRDITEIIGGIIVIILIVVIVFEKIGGRYHYGLPGWDIAEIIGWIFVIILILVIISQKIRERCRYGRRLFCRDIVKIIGWIFVVILIVVIIFEKIRERYRYDSLSAGDIAKIIGWIFVVILIVVIIFEKIRGRYRYAWKRHVSQCTHKPCCLREVSKHNDGSPKTAEDLLLHLHVCRNKPCCLKDEVIAWINRARPDTAEDLLTRITECACTLCCIEDEENAEDNDGSPDKAEDNLKPGEGNGTPEQQEILLENMGKVEARELKLKET